MEPNFNTWTIIFLIASAQGFFTALIFLKWRHGNPQANRILSALIALFSLSMFEYVLYWTNYIYYWPHFANLSVNFPFLYGALFWLYLRTIYTGKALARGDVWHLLPFLFASIPFLPWYFADGDFKRTVVSGEQKFSYAGWAIRLQFSARIVYIVLM
ncbi:MAG: hypothetical protein JNJ57_20455, partial [Saprospiraceae bacterium]|nr:hypothetical protein [Saprospiraceae bacterium]